MSIIHLETGNHYTTAAKGFFSICLVLLFYENNLSKLLTDDLQLIIFWAGILLLCVIVFPLIEWSWRVIMYLTLDRKLPEGSFSYWETLNQPQWENFTNNVFGDTYIIFGFIIIGAKLLFLNQDFIDQYPQLIPQAIIEFSVPIAVFVLLLIALLKSVYRIRKNRLNIELSQFYLTTIKINSENPPNVGTFFLNQAWPLFQKEFIRYYFGALEELKSIHRSIKKLSEGLITLRGPDDVLNRFQEFHKLLDLLWNSINNKNLYYNKEYSKFSIHSLLRELRIKMGFWQVLYSKFLGRIDQNSMYNFFKDLSEWDTFPEDTKRLIESLIQEAIRDKPFSWGIYKEKIDVAWVLSLHYDVKSLTENLEEFLAGFEYYINTAFKVVNEKN